MIISHVSATFSLCVFIRTHILPYMQRLWATIRVFTALFIVTVILVSNFGYCWFCGSICTRTQYKGYISPAGSRQEIEARVGVYIGLRGTNITLRETSCKLTVHACMYVEIPHSSACINVKHIICSHFNISPKDLEFA